MNNLSIACTIGLYKDVPINICGFILWISVQSHGIGIDQIELSVTTFDKIIMYDKTSTSILEVVAGTACTEWPKSIVSVCNAKSLGVGIMFVKAIHIAIVVNVVGFDEHVFHITSDEDSISTSFNFIIDEVNVMTSLDVKTCSIVHIGLGISAVIREAVARVSIAQM